MFCCLKRSRAGFTLLEAILVGVIIIIVVGAVSASLAGFLNRSRMHSAVGRVTSMAIFARSHALSTGLQVKMRIESISGEISLYEQEKHGSEDFYPLDHRWQMQLPECVNISSFEISGKTVDVGEVVFYPDGSAQEASMAFQLQGDTSQEEKRLWINKLTGRVKSE